MACCNNTFKLGCFDSCGLVTLPFNYPFDGNYTFYFSGANKIKINVVGIAGHQMIIDVSKLNEDMKYVLHIVDFNGDRFVFSDGSEDYDCFELTTESYLNIDGGGSVEPIENCQLMCAQTYDPNGVSGDAFDYNNLHTKAVGDGITITGDGTTTNPFVAVGGGGGGLTCEDLENCQVIEDIQDELATKISTEIDPIFSASPSFGITNANINNWNTAYGWGNHAAAGYVLASSLHAVAFSGDYTALNNTPTLLSQFTNDSGFITASALSPYLTIASAAATYQPILVSGTNIKTINGNSLLGSGDITIGSTTTLSALLAATATNDIDNGNFAQVWRWNNLGNGTALKLETNNTNNISTNTQCLLELRKSSMTSGGGYNTTLLRVINEDLNTASTNIGAHFEGRSFAITTGRVGESNQVFRRGDIGIQCNSGIYWINGNYNGAYIRSLDNSATLDITSPINGNLSFTARNGNFLISSETPLSRVVAFANTGLTNQRMVFGGDGQVGGYRSFSTHAGVIENNNGVFRLSANVGLVGGDAFFTPTWQLNIVGSTNNVGIGTGTPHASAKLEVNSTSQGFLPPRMTANQASAIPSPAEGLILYVFDTNGTFATKGWYGFDGATWNKLN